MKKFLIGCLGFSALCLAFSCGQQAGKQPANAAGAQAGSQWVHAVKVGDPTNDNMSGLLVPVPRHSSYHLLART